MTLTAEPIEQREQQLNSLYRIGILATLGFVTMTFAALAVVFLIRSRVPLNWNHIILPPILYIDTAILLASSAVFELAHRRLKANRQTDFYRMTQIATGLGLLFLVGQVVAWLQILETGQLVRSNPHSSFFFIFSGMHGAHILVGLAGMIALLVRTREPASGPKWQMNTRVLANSVSIFWHYLDFLWLVLFALLLFVKR